MDLNKEFFLFKEGKWVKNKTYQEKHADRLNKHIQAGKDTTVASSFSKEQILQIHFLRSLFDLEMCISCKYQRALSWEFIKNLLRKELHLAKDDQELNTFIQDTLKAFMTSLSRSMTPKRSKPSL
eukprot:CAMPEP_0170567038 /NCGR_PEP_ID=MMETSP0211-20121228/80227_1 /TAXON_ID=311385 /ORGANISM="Pseudokeronopsis sp., Strain OXSARD2" /LENGTH=124 /DNA_ID=CAMNT_0010888387 /DNA_START=530 /DNA_END=904 /DNA_ORIENTATION=+